MVGFPEQSSNQFCDLYVTVSSEDMAVGETMTMAINLFDQLYLDCFDEINLVFLIPGLVLSHIHQSTGVLLGPFELPPLLEFKPVLTVISKQSHQFLKVFVKN